MAGRPRMEWLYANNAPIWQKFRTAFAVDVPYGVNLVSGGLHLRVMHSPKYYLYTESRESNKRSWLEKDPAVQFLSPKETRGFRGTCGGWRIYCSS
jgi:hypothetical protein